MLTPMQSCSAFRLEEPSLVCIMKTKMFLPMLCAAVLLALVSCVSPKEVLYLQDVAPGVEPPEQTSNYQVVIQKDDQLKVMVSSKQPDLAAPFAFNEMNLGGSGSSSSSGAAKGYQVDSAGDIVLPVIGKMSAAGKTCTQLGAEIAAALRKNDYISDASVNVQIVNFKFSVLGEVGAPGTYTVDGERITILEAISRAGDLSIDGNRTVTIVREQNGERSIASVDLRSKDLFKSPYYYIQQNDVLYVTPAERKINTRSDIAQWYGWGLSGVAFLMGIIALVAA